MSKFAIRTQKGLLNGFYSNDLPITDKLYFNKSKNRLEPKFTMKNMMCCNGGYVFFDTITEAENYISTIKRDVEEGRHRYEKSLEGSTDQLLSAINKFKIIPIQ